MSLDQFKLRESAFSGSVNDPLSYVKPVSFACLVLMTVIVPCNPFFRAEADIDTPVDGRRYDL